MPRVSSSGEYAAMDAEIGRRLCARRRSLGWSQVAVAQAVGLTTQAVSKIESGVTSPPFWRIAQIARTLEIDVADVVFSLDRPTTVQPNRQAYTMVADAMGSLDPEGQRALAVVAKLFAAQRTKQEQRDAA